MKIVVRDILKTLRDRIDESNRKIKQDEEDIQYNLQVIRESRELIGRLKRDEESQLQGAAKVQEAE